MSSNAFTHNKRCPSTCTSQMEPKDLKIPCRRRPETTAEECRQKSLRSTEPRAHTRNSNALQSQHTVEATYESYKRRHQHIRNFVFKYSHRNIFQICTMSLLLASICIKTITPLPPSHLPLITNSTTLNCGSFLHSYYVTANHSSTSSTALSTCAA